MPTNAPSPIVIRTLESALELAQTRKWHAITLIEIAASANIPLRDLYGVADKDTLTDALEGWADTAMSAEAVDPEDTSRERLFDVIMRRFEHMESRRAGVLTLMQARDHAPARFTALLRARKASAQWALACAGLDLGSSTEQSARTLGLAWVIGKTERAWRKDESGDFARTMATLDAELLSLDENLKRLGRFSRKAEGQASSSQTPSQATQEETSSHEAPPAESDEA